MVPLASAPLSQISLASRPTQRVPDLHPKACKHERARAFCLLQMVILGKKEEKQKDRIRGDVSFQRYATFAGKNVSKTKLVFRRLKAKGERERRRVCEVLSGD